MAEFNKKVLGKTLGPDAGVVQKIVWEMDQPELVKLKSELENGWGPHRVWPAEMCN